MNDHDKIIHQQIDPKQDADFRNRLRIEEKANILLDDDNHDNLYDTD